MRIYDQKTLACWKLSSAIRRYKRQYGKVNEDHIKQWQHLTQGVDSLKLKMFEDLWGDPLEGSRKDAG
jgi:hypothetical protein